MLDQTPFFHTIPNRKFFCAPLCFGGLPWNKPDRLLCGGSRDVKWRTAAGRGHVCSCICWHSISGSNAWLIDQSRKSIFQIEQLLAYGQDTSKLKIALQMKANQSPNRIRHNSMKKKARINFIPEERIVLFWLQEFCDLCSIRFYLYF